MFHIGANKEAYRNDWGDEQIKYSEADEKIKCCHVYERKGTELPTGTIFFVQNNLLSYFSQHMHAHMNSV